MAFTWSFFFKDVDCKSSREIIDQYLLIAVIFIRSEGYSRYGILDMHWTTAMPANASSDNMGVNDQLGVNNDRLLPAIDKS